MRITEAPWITQQPPAAQTLYFGSMRLQVGAIGVAPLMYQWRRNGQPLAGATTNELARFNLTAADAGNYDVVVSNAFGSVTSLATVVTITSRPPYPTITRGMTDQTVRAGETVIFSVETRDATQVTWWKDGRPLPGGTGNSFTLRNAAASDSGTYRASADDAVGASYVSDFAVRVVPAQDRPVFTRPPVDTVALRGTLVRLNVGIDGKLPIRLQWRRNGVPIVRSDVTSGEDEPTLYISNFNSDTIGSYDVVATNEFGTATSPAAALSLPPPGPEGRLMNVSVRAPAGGAQGPLIVGFVLGGGIAEEVPLLIRAAGRALDGFGVSGAIANPMATVYAGASPRISNDDWGGLGYVAATAARVGAFPFPIAGSRDAALAPTLKPRDYTVHVAGVGGASGITLAEIYDATPAPEIGPQRPRLLNLSVQSRVQAGEPLIAGFALGGALPRTLLIRAVGPSLAAFNVAGALSDPQLTLFRGDTVIANNNDWSGDAALREAFGAVAAFNFTSTDSKDAALLVTLPDRHLHRARLRQRKHVGGGADRDLRCKVSDGLRHGDGQLHGRSEA